MVDDEKLIGILQQQIDVEKRTVEKLEKAEMEASETAVRLVFMDVRFDSMKHQRFLEGMVEILRHTPCDEWSAKVARYSGRVKLERILNDVIEDETKMIDFSTKALAETRDEMGRFLLEHLAEDERRHRKDLRNLVQIVKMAPLQRKKGQKGTDIVCE